MKYDVTITETLQRIVSVEAESREEAEQIVEDAWNKEEYVLGADDFVGADFEADEVKEENIKIVYVPYGEYATTMTIPNTLEKMQELVGGYIETVTLKDGAVIICNEEGLYNGSLPNRAVGDEKTARPHAVDNVIFGDFFIAYADGGENFKSLPKELAEKYEKEFKFPESVYCGREGSYSKLIIPHRETDYER